MNKKLFASALFAVAAFVSSIASAQLTYDNSNTDALGVGYLQDSNPKVSPGGAAVAGNVLAIKVNGNAGTQIPKDAEIIIRLPEGLNFSGTPSYLVSPGTPTVGLTLKDASVFGDPTLDAPKIELFDANGDGGMDRALVTAAAAGLDSDTLTITVNVTASAAATAGVKKASIIVNGGLAVTQDIVEVVSGFTTPVFSASGTKLTSIDQTAQTATVTAAKFTVTVPKGTAGGTKVTMTPQSKLIFSTDGGTTVTYTVSTPLKFQPFTQSGTVGVFATSSTVSISFDVTGTSTYSLPADTQVTFTVDEVSGQSGGTTGTRGLTISGAVAGTAALVDVKANGSSAKLSSGATNKAVDMVVSSSVEQTLPNIDITENFDGDTITVGGTGTVTFTPGTGLKFGSTDSITITGTNWGFAAVAPTASIATTGANAGKLTLTLSNLAGGSASVTISGIKATAASDATGDLSMTVGSPGDPDKSTAPNNTLVVAKAVALGTVSVAGPKTLSITGPGAAAGVTSTITFKETTYGALSKAAFTQVQDAYFRLTPNVATIKAITVSFSGYPSTTPTISACYAETNVTTGAWICKVTSESPSITPTTSTISLAVNYSAKTTATVGSKVTMAIDGNANVSGSVDVANVGLATTATKGAIPDVTPGDTDAVSFAKVTITEKFTGAVTANKEFRLLAPAGVAFQDATATATASPGIATATITSTFNPNDTLVMTNSATATIVFTPKGILASGNTGFQSFTLIDGNIDGANKSGISGESIMLAYGDGTLETLDAGANGSVNVGFMVQNTVEGGLNMGEYVYTVKSSDATIASPTISADVVTVIGKKVGNTTITVTDGLGATDTYVVSVAAGAAQPSAEKGTVPSSSTATFTSGASSDGGTSFETEFTTADDVTLVGTVNVAAADQGKDGEVYVAVLSKFDSGNTVLAYIDAAGNPQSWDSTIAGLDAHIVATPLADKYNVVIHSGTLAAGTYRVALAYSTEDGAFVYTAKAMVITVTE